MAGTAIEKLQPSRLSDQLEALADDVDLSSLNLTASAAPTFQLREAITAAQLERTIRGASTLTLTVNDRDRSLMKSGLLEPAQVAAGVDTKIDGLWWRLAAHTKQDNDLILTFEDREVMLLRKYPLQTKPKTWWRSWSTQDVTRTQFARALINDVAELAIRFVATESKNPVGATTSSADRKDATTKKHDREPGFAAGAEITVKNQASVKEQRDNIARVLDTGISLGLNPAGPTVGRLILIAAVMTITQESTAYNLHPGSALDGSDSAGLFQQRPSQGWPGSRDIERDSRAFYDHAIDYMKDHQAIDAATLCSRVQHDYTYGTSREGDDYARWRTEAEHTVDAYFGLDDSTSPAGDTTISGTSTSGTVGFFTRGRSKTVNRKKVKVRESNWACLQRLAQEVGWRCFCVSGTVYLCSDGHLFQSAARMTLSEDTDGVDAIDYEWDTGKRNATVTVTCRIGRWQAPPGSVAVIEDTGVIDGRWLVSSVSRSLFDPSATITLEKPQPISPEDQAPEFPTVADGGLNLSGAGSDGDAAVPAPTGSAQKLALELMLQLGSKWIDDNGRGADQIRRVAAGQQLHGAGGYVDMSPGPIRAVLWLIKQGYTVGTYAWCEDHSDDGQNGHAGGKAVDISSINRVAIATDSHEAQKLTYDVAKLLAETTDFKLKPRQLITGGYGNKRDFSISSLSIPGADQFYGAQTMQQHTNHIHGGY